MEKECKYCKTTGGHINRCPILRLVKLLEKNYIKYGTDWKQVAREIFERFN